MNPKDLDKESFWVKVHEDELASEDLFTELKQSFASKPVGKYMLEAAAESVCMWLFACSRLMEHYVLNCCFMLV